RPRARLVRPRRAPRLRRRDAAREHGLRQRTALVAAALRRLRERRPARGGRDPPARGLGRDGRRVQLGLPQARVAGRSRVPVALNDATTRSPSARRSRSTEAAVTSAVTGPTRTRARLPSETTEAIAPS